MTVALVIGLGRSGIAAARVLARDGWRVTLCDRSDTPPLQLRAASLVAEGIEVRLGADPVLEPAAPPQRLVASPGVPWDAPILVRARQLGVDTLGELELAWRYLRDSPWIGITGTNGKTTTTALVGAILKTAGLNAPTCGNIGNAACEVALNRQQGIVPDWIAAEVSSYQIESSRDLAPAIGIWTTFTPDHLERHRTIDNYFEIKRSLLQRSALRILNSDDLHLRSVATDIWPDAFWTSIKGRAHLPVPIERGVCIEGGWVEAFGERVLPVSSFSMVGHHNRQNLLLAVAAARLAGVDLEAIARAITNFSGVPHRLERLGSTRGIEFINDSKATNYDAAEVGLSAVDAPSILIAGGLAKTGDDSRWLQAIRDRAAAVLLVGKAAPTLQARLQQLGYDCGEIVETVEAAVPRALTLAEKLGARVVLLSPACASFDQFASFEERGDRFRLLCQQLGVSKSLT
ncbi:UDP-N-acetylmuramoylalanine--D-glutamateligase [Rubidibacter lacunae KORDI 51-2]|uniref:UDP-N-acetylmuramoylalanine--D-glutamate ligase n=1 Tax=Rubidibacter lacunae KORDI 51-2 TaxID=582515 RepID=U5DHU0_9CHRO|nr:UDP-N-acetylmuramoyl-L-alanine--D-glutamate ligase [Rubidibacter lacunae]ERN40169.1 UDP-N-acetylmuramoylalanine--D-glutamateligase [Rubidibacter lacunae KORDI 51-2]